jgi:nucleoside-diphosphate-sugar epimerase
LMESHADISSMQKLGWTPRVSLEEGLQRTIDFERRHAKSAQ